MYSLFKVYAYKGGELHSRINLSREELAEELSTDFENHFSEISDSEKYEVDSISELPIDTILEEMKNRMNRDFFSPYADADYDSFCGEIYEHRDGQLIEVKYEDFLQDIALVIKKNWE